MSIIHSPRVIYSVCFNSFSRLVRPGIRIGAVSPYDRRVHAFVFGVLIASLTPRLSLRVFFFVADEVVEDPLLHHLVASVR